MAYTFNGSTQYLSISPTVASTLPITLACWFYSTSSTVNQGLINICNSTGNAGFRLQAQGAITGKPLRATMLTAAATSGIASTAIAYPTNAWTHACGVFTSTTSRTVYLNGGNAVTDTTSIAQPATDRAFIGITLAQSAFVNYMAGQIAEVAIWNAALSAADVLMLSGAAAATLVRPDKLLFYAPLMRDLIDFKAPRTFTNNGTATVSSHPRIYL